MMVRGFVQAVALSLFGLLSLSVNAQELNRRPIRRGDLTHLTFRGQLKQPDGGPETEAQTLTFTIRDKEVDGIVRWQETQMVHPDAEGRYIAKIGSSSPVGMQPELMRDHSVLYVSVARPGATTKSAPVITTPQGVYQDCNLDGQECSGLAGETAISQVQKIGAAGFTIVLNDSALWGTAAQLNSYAAAANNAGVNLIWPLDDPAFANYATKSGNHLANEYSELGASCNCTSNKGFIQYVVGLVSKFPATYGYSLGDEPVSTTGSKVKSLYTIVHAADPNHDTIVNATFDDLSVVTLSNLQKNLDPFNFVEVLGADYYPYDTGAPISDTVPASKDTQTIANNYGKQSEFILQASSWQEDPSVCVGPCLYPTVTMMQTMLDDAAANMTPSFYLWFSYQDTVYPANHWADLLAAANPQ